MGFNCKTDHRETCHDILILGNGADLCVGLKTGYGYLLGYLYALACLGCYGQLFEIRSASSVDPKKHAFCSADAAQVSVILEDFLDCIRDHLVKARSASYPAGQASPYAHVDLRLIDLACLQYSSLKIPVQDYIGYGSNVFLRDLLCMIVAHQAEPVEEILSPLLTASPASFNALSEAVEAAAPQKLKEQPQSQNYFTQSGSGSFNLPLLTTEFLNALERFGSLLDSAGDKNSYLTGWLDVEQFIEYLVTHNPALEAKFYAGTFPDLSEEQAGRKRAALIGPSSDIRYHPQVARQYQEGIADFNRLLRDFFLLQEPISSELEDRSCDYQSAFERAGQRHHKSAFRRSNETVLSLSLTSGFSTVLDFNYTGTSALIFGSLVPMSSNPTRIYHLHSDLKKNNLVFGYSWEAGHELPKFCYPFEKKSLQIINHTEVPDFDRLLASPFNLTIFGHSCSQADSYVLTRLLEADKLNIALVLCHDEESLLIAFNNLSDMLEPHRLDHLIRGDTEGLGHLYFALEEPSSLQAGQGDGVAST